MIVGLCPRNRGVSGFWSYVGWSCRPSLWGMSKDIGQDMVPESLFTPLAVSLASPPPAVIASGMQSSRCGTGWGSSKAPNQKPGLGCLPSDCLPLVLSLS